MENRFKYNLQQLRTEGKLTQKDLATALHISVKTISHWETGYTEPSVSQIIELSQYFNVSFEDLLT